MADELPPAVAKFIADVSKWVGPLDDAINKVKDWEKANDDAVAKAGDLGNATAQAADDAAKRLDADKEQIAESAGNVGDVAGKRFVDMFTKRLSSLSSSMGGGGGGGGSSGGFFGKLLGGIGPGIMGIGMNKTTGIFGAITAALAALPALGGIAGTGIGVALIGGITAIVSKGAMSAVSPAVQAFKTAQNTTGQAAATAMKQYQGYLAALTPAQKQLTQEVIKADTAWQNFTNSMTGGVTKIMSGGIGLLPMIFKNMGEVFQAIVPQMNAVWGMLGSVINSLMAVAKAAIPAFVPFIVAIGSLVTNIMPGLIMVIKATVPVMGQFVAILSQLGSNLGAFFGAAAPAIKASMSVLSTLLGVVGALLPIIMKLGGVIATALAPVFAQLGKVIQALMPVLVIIGKVIGALAAAMLGDLVSAFTALAGLVVAISPGLKAFANAISGIFTVLENSGVFAILGDAIENLIKPLGTLVNNILLKLSPMLPPIIALVAQLANEAITILTSAVIALLPSITQLVTVALQALADLLPVLVPLLSEFAKILTPALVGIINGIAYAFNTIITAIPPGVLAAIVAAIAGIVLGIKAWAIAQVILDAAMAAGPWILFIAIIAGIALAIVEIIKHWHDVEQAFKDAYDFISKIVGDIVKWVGDHWKLLIALILGPIGLIIDALVTHWKAVEDGFKTAWNFVWNDVIHPIIKLIVDYIKLNVDIIKTVLSWFGKLGDLFKGWWNDVVNAIRQQWDAALKIVKNIPHDINSALGGLPAMMFNAGVHVIQDLINGIMSMTQDLGNVVSGIASKIAGFFGLSPAKEGPLSGGGSPFIRGLHFAMDIASGIETGRRVAASAAARLAATIAGSNPTGVASYGALQSQANYTTGVGAATFAGAGVAPTGDLIINVDGQKLLSIMQSQLYRYNVRNSGVATGILKPSG